MKIKSKKIIILLIFILFTFLFIYIIYSKYSFELMMMIASRTDVSDFYKQHEEEFEIIKNSVIDEYKNNDSEICYDLTEYSNSDEKIQKAISGVLEDQKEYIYCELTHIKFKGEFLYFYTPNETRYIVFSTQNKKPETPLYGDKIIYCHVLRKGWYYCESE